MPISDGVTMSCGREEKRERNERRIVLIRIIGTYHLIRSALPKVIFPELRTLNSGNSILRFLIERKIRK